MKAEFGRGLMHSVALAGLVAAALAATAPMAGAADKFSFAVPGIPPVYGGVVGYVARDAGIFARYGLDVTVKPMDSGAAAAKAVDSGSVDFSLSPSQFVVTMVTNARAPLKAIWGMEKPDWLIASMDAGKTSCASMKGQGVGVDSKRGARWIQLNTYLARKCKLQIDKDVPSVPMSSNVGTAMASGQITFGVLHIDDVGVIERMSGKKVHTIANLEDVAPGIHYLLGVARKDNLAKRRDVFVRFVAALRDAVDYMYDPANAGKVAGMAAPTKREPKDALWALEAYKKHGFWPKGSAGLTKSRIEKAVANQVRVGTLSKGRGGIKPDRKPVSYDEMVDLSVWQDAMKVKK
jgi:ABC-type nitrate/sulfonate/bicarbonate transport system substrate-binding protein